MDINSTKHALLGSMSPQIRADLAAKSPGIVLLIFVIVLASQLADVSWKLLEAFMVDQTGVPGVMVQTGINEKTTKNVDRNYASLPLMHLFGVTDNKLTLTATPVSAPDTRLSLILFGVFSDKSVSNGTAIIGPLSGKQKQYRVGDKITTGVWLAEVRKDYVLLKRGGNFEALRFPKQKITGFNLKRHNRPVRPSRLSRTKQSFIDNVRIIPVFSGHGKGLKGYRILPKQNRALYNRLGIMPTDIVTAINGISLSNEREAMKVIGELVNSDSVKVTIERGGQSISLNLKLE